MGHPNPVSQELPQLKFTSLPTEAEALRSILKAQTPAAIPKRAAKRTGKKVHDGATWFDPISKEWKEILEEREDKTTPKKKEGKSKSTKKYRICLLSRYLNELIICNEFLALYLMFAIK